MTPVPQFYAGKRIFITGGTGFLGIILTEKLLCSCPDIGTIYLLIRKKKGKNIQERIDALLVDPIFDVLRNKYPDFSRKIVGVSGDIAKKDLGLTATDHARIVNEVSVIFHLAATVRFDEKLERAVPINVNSVKYIVDIAKECKNLEAGVYVSTAYSYCVQKSINEQLYPPPLSYEEVNKLVDDLGKKNWSEEQINDFTNGVVKDWPNTYSFTKAIAEGVIADFAKELPFSIFRPSIVMNTYKEPTPGWINSPIGAAGVMCAAGLGILHTSIINNHVNADVVPVDYVCNALISCAWETGTTQRRPAEDISVYNYVSGSENPISWQQLLDKAEIFNYIYPANSAIYHLSVIRTRSTWIYSVLEFFLHFIPALMIDSVGKVFGKQLNLYKIALKIGNASRTLSYFTTQNWNFTNQRVQNLWQKIDLEDKQIFPFSMQDVDWDEHIMSMVRGIRKYIVRETEDNLPKARKRQFCLYTVHVIVRLVFIIFVAWATWKLFSGFGLTINAKDLIL